MFFTRWLHNLRSALVPGQVERPRRPSPRRRAAQGYRPHLDMLEDRILPSLTTSHFGPPAPFVVSFPRSVAVGDFNRDGNPDLAVVNEGDNTVSVLLGDGHGGFRRAPNSPSTVGLEHVSVAVGDFNGDGIPDLAVANQTADTVSVLLGNGDGTFEDARTFTVGLAPSSVAVGDFNGDGIPDLAVANQDGNTVSVLLGKGDGSFQDARNSSVGSGTFSSPFSVAVGDFNGDGIPDLVTANFFVNAVSVLLGRGDGTFQDAQSFAVGSGPMSLAVGDFNGDGAPDLAVPNFDSHTVSVLLNRSRLTTTVLTADPSILADAQLTTFTAQVSAAVPRAYFPSGVVTFRDADTVLGTGTLDANGQASVSTSLVGTGYHQITADYQGNAAFSASVSPVLSQLVNQEKSITTLALSDNPVLAGQPLTLTATVIGQFPNTGSPTGTVFFQDQSGDITANLGPATLSGGVATLTTTALAPGNHDRLIANYLGDNNFTAGNSPYQSVLVNNPPPVLGSLDTTTLPEGSAGFTLTLTGSGFLGSSTVQWNGTPLTITAANATRIQVMVPAALLADEGPALVTVSNPGPGGGLSLPQTFTVTDAPLAASPVNISVLGNKRFAGVVTTFTDGNPGATAADFTAVIVWDNGTASFGTVSGGNGSPFTVLGSHTFGAFSNVHTVQVTIFDKGGRTATVTDNLIDPPGAPPSPPPAGGSDPGAAALPGDGLPTARQEQGHHQRHGAGHRHHARHGRALPRRHQPNGPLAE